VILNILTTSSGSALFLMTSVYHITVINQPLTPTHPGHPFLVGTMVVATAEEETLHLDCWCASLIVSQHLLLTELGIWLTWVVLTLSLTLIQFTSV